MDLQNKPQLKCQKINKEMLNKCSSMDHYNESQSNNKTQQTNNRVNQLLGINSKSEPQLVNISPKLLQLKRIFEKLNQIHLSPRCQSYKKQSDKNVIVELMNIQELKYEKLQKEYNNLKTLYIKETTSLRFDQKQLNQKIITLEKQNNTIEQQLTKILQSLKNEQDQVKLLQLQLVQIIQENKDMMQQLNSTKNEIPKINEELISLQQKIQTMLQPQKQVTLKYTKDNWNNENETTLNSSPNKQDIEKQIQQIEVNIKTLTEAVEILKNNKNASQIINYSSLQEVKSQIKLHSSLKSTAIIDKQDQLQNNIQKEDEFSQYFSQQTQNRHDSQSEIIKCQQDYYQDNQVEFKIRTQIFINQ